MKDFAPPAIRKLYAKTVRLAKKQQFIDDRRANKKKQIKQFRANRKKEKLMTVAHPLDAQIDMIEATPTVLGVQLLHQIAVSIKTPGATRIKAAQALFRIGGLSNDRQPRRRSKDVGS